MTPLLLLLSLFIVPQAAAPRATSPDYTVGPDDVLDITIVGEPLFTNKYRVRRDGTFEFPNLGPIKASGQTLRALEELLSTRLQKENILLRPQITIEVAEFRSQTIYVMGQVADQGMVALTGSKTIVDVLAVRLLPTAGDEIVINRRKAGGDTSGPVLAATDPGIEVIKISKQDILNGRAASMVTLRDGDTIVVSKGASIYVIGEVKSPGPYVLEGALTVRQALALAGGPTPRAAVNRVEVLRTVGGKETKIKSKLSDLVQPGDTINVPPKRL
jgi:polysaccharide export outer membrane protein